MKKVAILGSTGSIGNRLSKLLKGIGINFPSSPSRRAKITLPFASKPSALTPRLST